MCINGNSLRAEWMDPQELFKIEYTKISSNEIKHMEKVSFAVSRFLNQDQFEL